MKILTVDIGTGTQDIYLFDSSMPIEGGYKLVLPAPTLMVKEQICAATRAGKTILLTGVTMGGGPCTWAVKQHASRGLHVFATPQAAQTFDDDFAKVAAMGVTVISEDEAAALQGDFVRIVLRDLDFEKITRTFTEYGMDTDDLAALAVGVFDHGFAPLDESDRKFRFNYLDERIRSVNRLSAFAYTRDNIPAILTRMGAVAESLGNLDLPLVVMDTSPAAVLGATFDPAFRLHERMLVANIGNGHTLAFRLGPGGIEGVFEHHSGVLDVARFDTYIEAFAGGNLENEKVYSEDGHGALIYSSQPLPIHRDGSNLLVTGPRRGLVKESRLSPRFAVPFGDMMLSGCFGMLAAAADHLPELTETIHRAMGSAPTH